MGKSRFYKELLILLVLLALGLRILGLCCQPLWWDEGYSLYASTMPIGEMIVETAEDIHPPLFYVLLHLWEALGGTSPASVRLFSVFIGVLAVLLIFQIGRYLAGYRLAWLAGIIAAVNPFLVLYSQEVRMYMLVTFLGLVSTYLMYLWLDARTGRSRLSRRLLFAAYLVVTAAALYTHYYATFIPLAQTVFVLLCYRRRPVTLRWLAGQGILVLAYLPWVGYTATRLASYVGGKVVIEQSESLGPLSFFAHHIAAFSVGHLPDAWSSLYWASLLFLSLAILGTLVARRVVDRSIQSVYLPILVLVSLAAGYIINLLYPFNPVGFERLLAFSAPGFYLMAAVGLLYLWQKQRVLSGFLLGVVLATSGLSLWVLYNTERYAADDYRPLIAKVGVASQPGDAVLSLYPWQIGYFRSYLDTVPLDLEPAFKQDWPARWDDPSLLPTYIDALIGDHGRVWFPSHQTGGRILEEELEVYLASNYHVITAEWANPHTMLFLFSTAEDLVGTYRSDSFADRIRLVESGLSQGPIAAGGGAVAVELGWQLIADIREQYHVGLRLVDETGHTWAQRSAEPVSGLKPFGEFIPGETVYDRHGLSVPAGAPPGRYRVKVGVYRRSDGRGLDVVSPDGVPQGTEADLGELEIILPKEVPSLNRLEVPYPRSVDLTSADGEVVRFLGHSLLGSEFSPGDELRPVLFWQPLTTLAHDSLVAVQILNDEGQVLASSDAPAGLEFYPASQWRTGFPVSVPQQMVIPPEMPEGEYTIGVGLSQSGSGERFSVPGGDRDLIELQRIRVSGGRPHDFTPPRVPHSLEATWGDAIRLLGYDSIPPSVKSGETISQTLYWEALDRMDTSYTVFVHLLDDSGMVRGQVDSIPGEGTLPTTTWIPGEYLRDSYSFKVKEDASAGSYVVEVGIYDAATGARLPVRLEDSAEETDHILLPGTISVRPQ